MSKHQMHGIDTSVAVRVDYDKCIGCQMCARTCVEIQKIGALQIAPLKQPPYLHSVTGKNHENTDSSRVRMNDTNCIGCGQCAAVCTTGAIQPANRTSEIQIAKSQGLTLVAVMAPATRIGVGEAMGMPVGVSAEHQIVAGLKKLGFNYVFDNLWGADVCTIEDTKEVLKAREAGKGPVFTSCCPAWINLVETKYPEAIPQISTAKSPTGMICSVIKQKWAKEIGKKPEDLFVVGIMPCTAKKFEALRPQLMVNNVKECDISISSRELMEMLKEEKIEFSEAKEAECKKKPECQFDAPFNEYSGSAYIFGKTAGVSESVVRYVYAVNKIPFSASAITAYIVWELPDKTQAVKILEFPVGDAKFRVCVASGGAAVEELMKIWQAGKLKGVDVVEVMMCPGGCINGGGQPKIMKKSLLGERPKGLDRHDAESSFADAESNKKMHEQLKKWLPSEHDIHDVLHTHYENRKMK